MNNNNDDNNNIPKPIDKFDDMGLKDQLLRGIYAYGFENPSLIQSKGVPLIMTNRDIIAQSQSGTGKTGTFTIGTLQQINENVNEVQAIILANTRELAVQISEVVSSLGKFCNINVVLCTGGQDMRATKSALHGRPTVVVGTPGRIIDLMTRKILVPYYIKVLVIDEADEILSESFEAQIKGIIQKLPEAAQICLFSATMPNVMLHMASLFMRDPVKLLIEREKLTLDGITQFYIKSTNDGYKFEILCDLYELINVNQTIVYVNTVNRGIKLKKDLEGRHFTVSLIHSNLEPRDRAEIMKEFKSGKTRILISTDLLSRGIDIQQISIVVNYDIPKNREAYLHRIGRSGRYGRKGVAINLVSDFEERLLSNIESHYDIKINEMPVNVHDYL